MYAPDANTDCLNSPTSLWTVIVQRRIQFMSFTGVICACQPFRDVIATNEDTLDDRYEQTMARLEKITRAVYQFKVQCYCEFDYAGLQTPELLAHLTVCQIPLCTRDTRYGSRTEAIRLHFKAHNARLSRMWN